MTATAPAEFGDLAVSGKVSLFQTPHGGQLVAAGLGAELPTGSKARGLGGGHVEMAPFVGISSALGVIGSTEIVA